VLKADLVDGFHQSLLPERAGFGGVSQLLPHRKMHWLQHLGQCRVALTQFAAIFNLKNTLKATAYFHCHTAFDSTKIRTNKACKLL
jgi:hypothetical protein